MSDLKNSQIEGQPDVIRQCDKCNKEYKVAAKFCMECGNPIIIKKVVDAEYETKQLLNNFDATQVVNTSMIVFQRQPDNFTYVTTMGELRNMKPTKANTINTNGTIDIRIDLNLNNSWLPIKSTYNSLHISIPESLPPGYNVREIFGIRYSVGASTILGQYLSQIIDHEITDPVIRSFMCFQIDKDCTDIKIHNDELVTVKVIYDQIDSFPTGTIHDNEQWTKLHQDLTKYYYLRIAKNNTAQEAERQSARQTFSNWDITSIQYFDEELLRIKKSIDELMFAGGVTRYPGGDTPYSKLYGDYKCPAFNPNLLPKRSLIPTKEDAQLKELFTKIRQDVFYSRKTRKLYTLDELIELFKLEGQLFGNLNFRERSKHIKIFNIDAYILNENVDGLFYFIEARKHTSKIKELVVNGDYGLLLMKLFGF